MKLLIRAIVHRLAYRGKKVSLTSDSNPVPQTSTTPSTLYTTPFTQQNQTSQYAYRERQESQPHGYQKRKMKQKAELVSNRRLIPSDAQSGRGWALVTVEDTGWH
jgi:hypothetical protein